MKNLTEEQAKIIADELKTFVIKVVDRGYLYGTNRGSTTFIVPKSGRNCRTSEGPGLAYMPEKSEMKDFPKIGSKVNVKWGYFERIS
jgi:hypothetical protein